VRAPADARPLSGLQTHDEQARGHRAVLQRVGHACLMAVYAHDILTGDMPGPYTDTDAEHFAHLVTNADRCDAVSALTSAPDGRSHTARRRRPRRLAVSPLPGPGAQRRRCR